MIEINRSALAQSHVAGGATKAISSGSPDPKPSAPTQSGSATSVITVNGKTVINQSVTF